MRRRQPRVRKLDQPDTRRYVQERLRQRWSPDQSLDVPAVTFHATESGSSRTRRFTLGLTAERPPVCVGVAFCGAPAGSRKTLTTAGEFRIDEHCRPSRRRGRPTPLRRLGGRYAGRREPSRRGRLVGRAQVGLSSAGRRRSARPTVCGIAAEKFRCVPPALRKTLTLDNGKEFADHERLAAQAALKIYFADPYCAWQRGTNENTNGLIRQFLPKGTDLARIPKNRFLTIQQLLNDRPRKRLGYQTPSEILSSRFLHFRLDAKRKKRSKTSPVARRRKGPLARRKSKRAKRSSKPSCWHWTT